MEWFNNLEDWMKGLTIGIPSWFILALCCLALGGVKLFLIMMCVLAVIGMIAGGALIFGD